PSTSTAPGRSPIASSSRATWAGRRNGMSAASSASRGARTSASPARSAGTGPAPGGSSRTTTAPGSTPRGGPTTISRDAPDTAAAAHSIRARPPSGAAGLSAPNRRARPPASRTASNGAPPPGDAPPGDAPGAAATSAADRRHRPGGLQKGRVVDAVPGALGPHRLAPPVGELGVTGARPHRVAQVGLLGGEQAVADLPVGGEPHPVAGAAER